MQSSDFDLGQLFGRSREALIIVDAESSRVVLWNPAAAALFGYTVDEAVELLIDDLLPPRLRSLYRERLTQYQTTTHAPVIDAGRPVEMPMLHRAGSEIAVELTLGPIAAVSGRGRYVLAVIRDASERRRIAREREQRLRSDVAQAEAEAARQRLLNLVEGLSAILWETEIATGRFRFVSQRAEALLGYPAQRWLDDPDFWLTIILPDDREQTQTVASAVAAVGGSRLLEFRVATADGRVLFLRGTIDVGRDAAGAAQVLRGVVLDVSEQKRAEATLHFLAEASSMLASAGDVDELLQRLVRIIVPAVAEFAAVHVVEADGQVRREARMHADRRQEQRFDALRERYPADPAGSHPVAQVLRTGTPLFLPRVSDEFLHSFSQDETHWSQLRQLISSYIVVPLTLRGWRIGALTLIRSGAEQPFGPMDFALALDLAERVASAVDKALLYEAERTARTEAEAALAMRDQFLSMAAHELRTPLTPLRVSLQLITKRLAERDTGADLTPLLELVNSGMVRLSRLVNDLLHVSRIAKEGLSIKLERVELRPLVERVVELERAATPPRTIVLSHGEVSPVLLADSDRMQQVLENLLQNARKYSPPDTPIQVGIAAQAEAVLITVRDEGIGVPPEERERIFERFHRAGNADAGISGLGIGLFVAREIVTAHGGEIRVESELGAGSTFTVALPLRPSSAITQCGGA